MSNETDPDPGRIYRILGQLYLEPPSESTVSEVAAWANQWHGRASHGLSEEIAEPLGTLSEMDPGLVETIRAEYTRLFRGATNQPSPDPPYESLYREDTIYGSSTTAVRESYLQAGLDLTDEGESEPPDQLGIELQFVGELRSREAGGDEESRAQLQAFIEDHVGSWFDDFEDAVEEHDPHPFYGAVVSLTGALLRVEADRLDADWYHPKT
ncbi:chaperone protein TorD [Halodesulfurarchaeum formicicum]|uniref:Chaperone protein TorD n=1 Tax=Halodesulfurarchaeum formicicum TaxID=1873524 RepID=A0A1D8S3A1_9EURY|nr:molecular chaperone TorD family protein [Halodesulfurarchaeum formicicum]AOW79823.1 chaperone protein TorD [Halodesulfurarchaeum formicicum]